MWILYSVTGNFQVCLEVPAYVNLLFQILMNFTKSKYRSNILGEELASALRCAVKENTLDFKDLV